MEPGVPGSSPGGGTSFRDPDAVTLKSPQARYAAHVAKACGYAFRSLDGADGYLFEVSDGPRRAAFAAGAGSPYALNDVRAASIARDKAFCATILTEAGLPVLPGEMFFVTERWAEMRRPGREPADALRFAAHATYPMFCKPISGSNGLFAEVIGNAEEFASYMSRVSGQHFAVLLQPYIQAPEHRVFVLHGRALFSYLKHLPVITGDGVSTLRALIDAIPRDMFAPQAPMRPRDASGAVVSLEQVVENGGRVFLQGPANRSAGGGASVIVDNPPESMAALAIAAARAVGLQLAAVDIFDRGDDGLTVIEVNSNPMIATLEDAGRWDLIETIWRANIEAALG